MPTNDYGFFFNSINGDRVYDADSFSTWLRKFFTSGVFEGELAVTATEGMAVEVGSGYANVDGKVRFFNSPQTVALSPANSTYPRIDTIVVERNDVNREISLKYITGQYSGNTPSPTERQWGNGVYQLVLAQVYVGAGVTSISQANIADTRPDSNLCGYVVGTVEEIDLSQILAQSQEQFAEWFDHMKDQLSDDAAGNLQLEIDSINDVLYDPETGGTHLRTNLTVDNLAHFNNSLYAARSVVAGNNYGFSVEDAHGHLARLLWLTSDDVCIVGHNSCDTNILGNTITMQGVKAFFGPGDTWDFTSRVCSGLISNGQTALQFFVPSSRVLSGTPTCTALSIILRHADGGYPYARSGRNGGTFTQLGGNAVSIWAGGETVRNEEVTSVVCTNQTDGVSILVTFGYQLAAEFGNLAAAVTNNVPVAVTATGTITFA